MSNRITDENLSTLFDETSNYPLKEWIFNCPLEYSSINITKGCITLKISLPEIDYSLEKNRRTEEQEHD